MVATHNLAERACPRWVGAGRGRRGRVGVRPLCHSHLSLLLSSSCAAEGNKCHWTMFETLTPPPARIGRSLRRTRRGPPLSGRVRAWKTSEHPPSSEMIQVHRQDRSNCQKIGGYRQRACLD
ncbi:hypothetical protein BD311DRAFT_316627 [Dichomitus squalens]|uniref:Uncharacterized protein n=1 Tax=Dichomitus squalens TaxID=114155 RepID=A0A4Q9MLP4_9APHY|nr:hypothetical protein BD311DRAFT_316627 [Dichomitus squalens]